MLKQPKIYTRKCRYCEVSRAEGEMKKVPDNKKIVSQWIRILGTEFAENIQGRTSNFICRTHFLNNGAKLELPVRGVLGGREEEEEQFMVDEVLEEEMPPPKHRLITCRYCGKTRDQKMATTCPENKTMLNKWIRILGRKFGENVKNNRNNYICRSHFENLHGPRKPDHLPIRDIRQEEEEEEEEERDDRAYHVPAPARQVVQNPVGLLLQREIKQENVDGFDRNRGLMARPRDPENLINLQCRVCQVYTDEEKLMTLVPREIRELYKWFDILGTNFAENVVKNQEPHYICLCHLKDMVTQLTNLL